VPDDVAAVRRRLGIPEHAFVAVSVRRLVRRMGLDVLIDAWADRVAELPPDSLLLIAGDGPVRDELEAQIDRRGLSGSVVLLGKVTEEDLVALYQAADVNVIPTRAHEGFGLVALEAAACGTPSIVTAVGGLPEAISGLDASLIVQPDDAAALGDRLVARHALPGPEAARSYAEGFNWEGVAARHRQIARKAIRGGDATRHRVGRPFRVVYLDHVAKLSGGEIALLRLLPHLDRVEPHVILAEDGPLVGRLHMEGVSTEVMEMPDSGRGLRKDRVRAGKLPTAAVRSTAAYVLALAARLRRLSPDLVHTNSMKAGVYGSLAARLAGIPMIWHVRDHIDDSYLPPHAVGLIRRMTRHLPTAVVANSRSTMETLRAPSNPVVIYSVLPEVLSEVQPLRRRTRGPLTFGVLGRLAPWKGQDFFLRAFAAAFPGGDERAAIVGGALFGEDEYARSLPALAEQLGIAERVELRGHRSNVWEELSRLDVLVHSSISPEPFGQVILEGMAAGVPVIAAGAGGPAEILSDRVTGILYAPNDLVELAAAMRSMHDQQLRNRLTVAARDALGPYSPAVVAAQLQTVYSAVVARARR
jgi:glycosyltransferase involved in cell wall biosynthesis